MEYECNLTTTMPPLYCYSEATERETMNKNVMCLMFALCLLFAPAIAGAVTVELYVGGGTASASGKDAGSNNSNWWSKLRLLPIHVDNLDMGVYGSAAGGTSASEDATDPSMQYESTWKRQHGGISILPKGSWGDGHLDIGYGRKSNEGHIRLFKGKQTENVVAISAGVCLRTGDGQVLPKVDINVDAIFPNKERSERSWDGKALGSQVSEDKYWEASIIPWLYRFSNKGGVTLYPGITAAYGESGGDKFNKFGVAIKIGNTEYSIIEVSAGTKKFSGDDKKNQFYVNGFVTAVRF